MPKLDFSAVRFSINCYVAAMLALWIGFAIDLPRPYWSVMVVYIISQPTAGAVRSKAFYRVLGTLLGAAFSVLVVPVLVDAPWLLSLVLALWVGGCLGISMLDRTPRAYIVMLAGYTAALISFPTVSNPEQIFDVAIARVEETTLGILCAALTHSLLFPRPVGAVIHSRLTAWLRMADEWATDVLHRKEPGRIVADRRHLATAATEVHLLSQLLPFDVSDVGQWRHVIQAAHERFLLLIPLLSAVNDRLAQLAALPGGIDGRTADTVRRVGDWVAAGADPDNGRLLAREIDEANAVGPGADWAALLRGSLASRLADLTSMLSDAHDLLAQFNPAGKPAPATSSRPPKLHRDPGLALRSGLSATLAIMMVCSLWIVTGWADGASAAAFVGLLCAVYSSLDDLSPALVATGVSFGLAIVVSALYQFVLLPRLDGFFQLALFLAPTFLVGGYLSLGSLGRGAALWALNISINLSSILLLQESYGADFAAFANTNLGFYVGLFVALMATRLVRSLSLDMALRRLFRRNWTQLAQLARRHKAIEIGHVAAEMVDRLGLIASRLSAGDDSGPFVRDPIADLRIGMNLAQIGNFRNSLSGEEAALFNTLLDRVGAYFAALSAGRVPPPVGSVLDPLDRCLSDLARTLESDTRRTMLAALVGLRRNLFPDAPAFRAGISS